METPAALGVRERAAIPCGQHVAQHVNVWQLSSYPCSKKSSSPC